jgi:hypothetical protein
MKQGESDKRRGTGVSSRRLVVALSIILALAMAIAGSAEAAAGPSPAWSLTIIPYPTNFEPGSTAPSKLLGPGYLVVATNIGGAATAGEFKIVDTLPAGLGVSPSVPPFGSSGPGNASAELVCSAIGEAVTCGTATPLAPGQTAVATIPLQATAAGPTTVLDAATVEGGGAAAVSTRLPTAITTSAPPFGFLAPDSGSFGAISEPDGTPAVQAGTHPYQLGVGMNFNFELKPEKEENLGRVPGGGVRNIVGELPSGLVVDPRAATECTEAELESHQGCPSSSQIGTVMPLLSFIETVPSTPLRALYNMQPPNGSPAEFGFEAVEGIYLHLFGRVRSDGDYGLSAEVRNIPAQVGIYGAVVSIWGNPTEASHDEARGSCLSSGGACPTARTDIAGVTVPDVCGTAPFETTIGIENWIGAKEERAYPSAGPGSEPLGVEGCDRLPFEPSITAASTTPVGDSPSGLSFDLHQTQHQSPTELAQANLKDVSVALPVGMALNPSAGGGLEACSSGQIGLTTPVGQSAPVHFTATPQSCPPAAKLGVAEVVTPLLGNPLKGDVYLAKPFENPFGSLLAIYIAIEDERTGIVAKLAGKVTPDPNTAQLVTTFAESPDLPLEDIRLQLDGGSRAPLTTPMSCGTHTTTSNLTPWSTPEGADGHTSASFETTTGCSASESQAPKNLSFTAGTSTPLAGAYSPFVLRISRPDGSQHISGIETTLPAGLLGKLAGVPYCPEASIAQARSREVVEGGKEEQASSSCPPASEVGTVNVTAGSGESPIPVSGHAYLAGPYKGAPLSLVVIVPAVAGPFDLGTVVDRVALYVGEYDARIHAVADPLPTIREGIPLDVRSIELKLDRPGFTLNPTSCEARTIEGSVSTQAGQRQTVSNRFQVGECGRLAFKPKLKLDLKGATRRAGLPAVRATVTYPKGGGYANIAKAQVALPHSEFLEQDNLNKTCTKPVVQAGACPASTIYGKAKAWSPLLEDPLEGPIYLVGGYGYKLPALVAELDGQVRFLLVGKIDTGKNGGIRSTFEAVPDAPVEKFVLELKGGKKYGLLINSENLCKKPQKAEADFGGQNGRVENSSVKIADSCGKKGKHKQGATGNGHKKEMKPKNKGKKSTDRK